MATTRTPRRRSPADRSAVLKALGEREGWLREQGGLTAASRAQTIRDLEDLGSREEDTQRDYVGRYAIELLQNAHDACADAAVKGTVAYVLRDHALIVANQGKPFDAKRVRSLVRQGMSEKAQRRRKRTIGYKGVGFSAVFEASASPQIITVGGLAFGFDRDRARQQVEQHLGKRPRKVAARNFPFRLSPTDWAADADVIAELFARGFVTAIRLPLRSDVTSNDVEQLLDEQIHPETLVFLPSVRRIELHRDQDVRALESSSGVRVGVGHVVHVDATDQIGRERASWLVHSSTMAVTRHEVEVLDDPAWADVAELRATVGLPWANRTIDATTVPTRIHLYFPTAETTGRACLLHGDFRVDSGRSHIFDKGPSGELNRKLAAVIAGLTAELSESVAARHGAGVLAALAQTGTPSAFGQVLNEQLDARLAQADIVRPADDSAPGRPGDMKFVSDRSPELDARLIALMTKRSDLVRVGDYRAAGVVRLLGALHVVSLTSAETARRVSIARTTLPYEKALELLQDWIDDADYHSTGPLVAALRERRILKDVDGGWCRPDEAVLSIDGVPPLPSRLRRVELKPVRGKRAQELLGTLDITALGPAEALGFINQALDDGTLGAIDDDQQELHDWLLALYRRNPDALKQQLPLRGRAPVRARDASGTLERWAPATAVYFGRGWSDVGEHMETLYGVDDEPHFLAGDGKEAPKALRDFYAALGVYRLPRLRRPASPHAREASKWRSSAPVREKAACPDGHTQSPQPLKDWVVDQLDPILARAQVDPGVAEAFNELFAKSAKPYGDDATFTCDHGNHRNKAKPRAVPGYQRWRLRSTPWVLVVNEPGGRTQGAPTQVWSGVPRSQAALLLPRPKLASASSSFELVAWDRPSVDAVEGALADVRAAFPDLHVAPEAAQETADVLLHKLESALGDDEERDPIFLPGTIGDQRAWVDDGVVLDLPGLAAVPGLPIVHVARTSRIRAAYGLDGAHERLDEEVLPGEPVERPALLSLDRRAAIVALMGRRGAARRELAKRLAVVDERQVARIDVEVALSDGRTHPLIDLPFKLVSASAPPALFLNDPELERALDLAAVLADYLDVPADAERLALALLSDELARRLHPSELAEATELLSQAEEHAAASTEGLFVPSQPAGSQSDEATGSDDGVGTARPGGASDSGETAGAGSSGGTGGTGGTGEVSSSGAASKEAGTDSVTTGHTRQPRDGDSTGQSDASQGIAADEPATDRATQPASAPRPPSTPPPRGTSRPNVSHPTPRQPHAYPDDEPDRSPLPDPLLVRFGDPVPATESDSLPPASSASSLGGHGEEARSSSGDGRDQAGDGAQRPPRSHRDQVSEKDAISYVREYARRVLGVTEIRDRQKDRCGWDLEFVYPDDRVELVEVKGSIALGPFEITRNELQKSRKHYGTYVVYVLAAQNTPRPLLLRFDEFGARVAEEHLRASSWDVVGWRELNPVVIDVELPDG
ncbi:MAG: hypothetical protein V7607_6139 [Solirubrobacteraceae bacterium]